MTIGGKELDEVEKFTYLGSVINKTGGTDEDINARICKARQSINQSINQSKESYNISFCDS